MFHCLLWRVFKLSLESHYLLDSLTKILTLLHNNYNIQPKEVDFWKSVNRYVFCFTFFLFSFNLIMLFFISPFKHFAHLEGVPS